MSVTTADVTPEFRGEDMYDLGHTTIFSCRDDPRFSFCMYVPRSVHNAESAPELVVAVHGTGRTITEYRDAFSHFARWNNCVVLCPLFPVGVLGDDNRNGYKYIREGDIRYDLVLLSLVEQINQRYGFKFKDFGLFGFSGGGHFTHRFTILHPSRVWAASVGAPGSVTLLNPEQDWWVGTRNVAELFNIEIDVDSLARVPVQMIVGDADIETWEITHKPGGRHWMDGANDAGQTRPERLDTLRRSFEAAGVNVQFDVVPGVSHRWEDCIDRITGFFADILEQRRASGRI
ncbi:hypothetical protein [Advenella mimigardefordensis]|uniref:Putative hydrolase n=1 Tax=Advenella mimigardefordensis (strain DSM 17166 / LMG 22922 / DPN7) TaxID=1247726 RepID=W0PGD0_ADVMD|nr:hypothetical protein [Advenella mimigardefordensis]AHG66134.1 putative hydrolase [Advenella mimigardefordensis DPN7]